MKMNERWYVLQDTDRKIYLSRCAVAVLKYGKCYKAGTAVAKAIYDDDIGFEVLHVCDEGECLFLSMIERIDQAVCARNRDATNSLIFALEDLILKILYRPSRPPRSKKNAK